MPSDADEDVPSDPPTEQGDLSEVDGHGDKDSDEGDNNDSGYIIDANYEAEADYDGDGDADNDHNDDADNDYGVDADNNYNNPHNHVADPVPPVKHIYHPCINGM
jgi:hypothetical protein